MFWHFLVKLLTFQQLNHCLQWIDVKVTHGRAVVGQSQVTQFDFMIRQGLCHATEIFQHILTAKGIFGVYADGVWFVVIMHISWLFLVFVHIRFEYF